MMRFKSTPILFAFLLASCSGEQAPTLEPSLDEPMVEELPVAPEPTDNGEAAADGEQPQMVEESAADESPDDATDKPLILAQAEPPETPAEWKYSEGRHYARITPTQPTVGGADRVEVAEIFWYGCNHCYDFEPFVNRWKDELPPNARFVRIPAVWNPLVKLHAQIYYTEEILARDGKVADPETLRAAFFAEYHRRGNRLASEEIIQEVFEQHGVSAEDFSTAWRSFEVAQNLRLAEDLGRRYGITSVPSMVVNGKYRTGAADAGGYPQLLEVLDELILRESIR